MTEQTPQTIYLRDYRPPEYEIESIDLSFSLHEDHTLVTSTLAVRARAKGAGPLHLDGEDLELVSLTVNGQSLSPDRYTLGAESLTVQGMPDSCTLEVVTRIDPKNNTSLEGLYASNTLYCTQCEAEGFRKITYFPDRPDVMASYTTRIEADKARFPVLLANGNLLEQGDLPGGRHFALWQDPFKKPCYLFAMVAGDLVKVADRFTTCSGRSIALEIYVEPHNHDKCGHAIRSLQKAMAWDEQVFGLEYDLDQYMIVAVDDFNAGAMENKGLNIFNSACVLAKPETATDQDYEGIEAIVAHEYFHNWTGNRVTCRDWFQLSLKEGLTVFRDQEFSADMASRAVKRITDVWVLRNAQFPEDSGPMAHPVRPDSYIEVNNFYTVTVYEKGAEVIRMEHALLGPELFRQGMDLYFSKYDGQAVTCDDFLNTMADVYRQKHGADHGVDFEQFRLWYSQAGTPELRVAGVYEEESRTYALEVEQVLPPQAGVEAKPMLIPMAVGLLDSQGRQIPLQLNGEGQRGATTRVLHVTDVQQTFRFQQVAEKPIPSLLRGFSAPVKLFFDYQDQDLEFLLLHDQDPFNRWEAGQRLAIKIIQGLMGDFQAGRPMVFDSRLAEIFSRILTDDSLADKALVSRLLTLPASDYLAELSEVVDVDAIHQSREFLSRELARHLKDLLLKVHDQNIDQQPYGYDPQRAAARSLKNLCLAYLMKLDDQEIMDLCLAQLAEADNMSDEYAALAAIAHKECSQRPGALSAFIDKWQHDSLVVDKWFWAQSSAPLATTLAEVKELTGHPLFSIKNPNKVHALIGSFAARNPVCFHAADGAGYRFLADRVLELDPLNPSVASRLLNRGLSRWRKYDPARQALMKAELERVAAAPSLSKGVYEVASRSLQG